MSAFAPQSTEVSTVRADGSVRVGDCVLHPYRSGRAAVDLGHAVRLQAEGKWVLRGPASTVERVAVALPSRAVESHTPGMAVLAFGNAVGWFDAGPLGRIQVITGKWSEDDYDRLVERVAEQAAALPYSAGAASALPFERTVVGEADVLYHAFTYLEHACSDAASADHALGPALRGIVREPHRRFQRTGRVVPIGAARRIAPAVLHDVVAGRWPLELAPRSRGGLSEQLRGYVPSEIEERVAENTLDTVENRFVKAFLAQAAFVVERMRERALVATGHLRARILSGCDAITRVLAPPRQHAMWASVGTMVQLPAGSSVLQRQWAYRTVFRVYNRMWLGSRVPVDPETAASLLEVKDIATLYEIWSCFAVIRAVTDSLGPPGEAGRLKVDPEQLGVPWEFRATWDNGVQVTYNPSYSRSRPAKRRSYSVPLRPDITLTVPPSLPNEGVHVFDAKFKVDWLRDAATDVEDGADESGIDEAERRGVFKRADIYKMHAYRDALLRARSAWVLYPGTETRFFPVEPRSASLDGVGAVPLTPAGEHPELSEVVGRIVG